jgi:hypothetical protein
VLPAAFAQDPERIARDEKILCHRFALSAVRPRRARRAPAAPAARRSAGRRDRPDGR